MVRIARRTALQRGLRSGQEITRAFGKLKATPRTTAVRRKGLEVPAARQTRPRRVHRARPAIVRRGRAVVVSHVAESEAVALRRGPLPPATAAIVRITPAAAALMSRHSTATAATGRLTAARLTAEIAAATVSSRLT